MSASIPGVQRGKIMVKSVLKGPSPPVSESDAPLFDPKLLPNEGCQEVSYGNQDLEIAQTVLDTLGPLLTLSDLQQMPILVAYIQDALQEAQKVIDTGGRAATSSH